MLTDTNGMALMVTGGSQKMCVSLIACRSDTSKIYRGLVHDGVPSTGFKARSADPPRATAASNAA